MATVVVAGSNNDNSFAVIDFSTPASPVKALATPPFSGGCMVDCNGTLAAAGNYNGGQVAIFDISNPALPVLKGSIPHRPRRHRRHLVRRLARAGRRGERAARHPDRRHQPGIPGDPVHLHQRDRQHFRHRAQGHARGGLRPQRSLLRRAELRKPDQPDAGPVRAWHRRRLLQWWSDVRPRRHARRPGRLWRRQRLSLQRRRWDTHAAWPACIGSVGRLVDLDQRQHRRRRVDQRLHDDAGQLPESGKPDGDQYSERPWRRRDGQARRQLSGGGRHQ